MRVAPRRVHDQASRVVADGLSKCLGPMFDNDVPPTNGAWQIGVEWRAVLRVFPVLQLRNDDISFETRLALFEL